jgi:hypothetical protein
VSLHLLDPHMVMPSRDDAWMFRTLKKFLSHSQTMKEVVVRHYNAVMDKKNCLPLKGRCPWGFRKKKVARVRSTRTYYYKLKPQPYTIEVGARVQALVDQRFSYTKIAKILNQEKLKRPYSNAPWTEKAVKNCHEGYQEYLDARITYARFILP